MVLLGLGLGGGVYMKYLEPLWVNLFEKHYGKTILDPSYFRKKSSWKKSTLVMVLLGLGLGGEV